MNDQWVKARVTVSTELLGADIDFYDGSSGRVDTGQVSEKLFRQSATRNMFTLYEISTILLKETNTRKQDLVQPAAISEALDRGVCKGKPDLAMDFTPGAFDFCIADDARDIKRIVFDVEFTVRP